MRRLSTFVSPLSLVGTSTYSKTSVSAATSSSSITLTTANLVRLRTSLLFCSASASASASASQRQQNPNPYAQREQQKTEGEGESKDEDKSKSSSSSSSLAQAEPEKKTRNIRVMSNSAKGMYIHFPNLHGQQAWVINDLPILFWGFIFLFVGSQVYVRYKVAKRETAEQAKLGETLLDNRTRDLLGDVESLRNKDPLRLESEANLFHEQFWKRRAKSVADARTEKRSIEIARGQMQGVARGTDMSEWMGAKQKDEQEREVARRTHDYIQGFHQHLKAKRLI